MKIKRNKLLHRTKMIKQIIFAIEAHFFYDKAQFHKLLSGALLPGRRLGHHTNVLGFHRNQQHIISVQTNVHQSRGFCTKMPYLIMCSSQSHNYPLAGGTWCSIPSQSGVRWLYWIRSLHQLHINNHRRWPNTSGRHASCTAEETLCNTKAFATETVPFCVCYRCAFLEILKYQP